jgi:hypothetical protein
VQPVIIVAVVGHRARRWADTEDWLRGPDRSLQLLIGDMFLLLSGKTGRQTSSGTLLSLVRSRAFAAASFAG